MTKKTKKIGLISFAAASALAISVAAGVAKTDTTLTVSANTGTVTLGTTEVDLSNFVTYYGASIRANANTPGLRFKSGIPASEYAKITAIEGVTLGTLIVPADLLEENEEIKFENLAQGEYADCVAVNFETKDPDKTGNVEFSGVLTKIKDYNINRSFRSRAYIKYQPTGESTPTYYYSNYYSTKAEDTIVETFDNARSVANVAYTASNDTEYTYKDEQYDMFDSFIAYRPNALTEDFERTISDVCAYGVYAATGTTASIITENAVNGNGSLFLDGADITVAVQTPMLGNIVSGGKLTLKATSAVSLTSLENVVFSATVSEQTAEGYYNVTLSAEDTQTVVSDYGFIIKCTESVTIDDIGVAFETVTPNGKTTMQDALDTTFGNLSVKASNLQQVLTSGNSPVAATTVLQKGGKYTANATVSADGYNDETVTVTYKVDPNYQKCYDAYIDSIAPKATIKNDGESVTVDTTAARSARTVNGFVLVEDATKGDVLQIGISQNATACVFTYDSLDVSEFDSLRMCIKTIDTMTSGKWYNAFVSVNGVVAKTDISGNYGAIIANTVTEGWLEISIPKSAYEAALVEGKYVNTIAFYSTSGSYSTTIYLDYLMFANGFDFDFSKADSLPSMVTASGATLATINGTQALKVDVTGTTKIITGLSLNVTEGQRIVMEVLSCEDNEGGGTNTLALQYLYSNKNQWMVNISPTKYNNAKAHRLYTYTADSNAAARTITGIQLYPSTLDSGATVHNLSVYIKSIEILDAATTQSVNLNNGVDFTQYAKGTKFSEVTASTAMIYERNGQNLLCWSPTSNTAAQSLKLTFTEPLNAGDKVTIEFAYSSCGFNVKETSINGTQLGYNGTINTSASKTYTITGNSISTIVLQPYASTYTIGVVYIKSITVTRGA